MQTYIIGIDTGGTCTDGALINAQTRDVVTTAKVATTHYDLSRGIFKALDQLLCSSGISPEQLGSVYISTTLATNSVVEKKGARVGLFVIGYVKHFKLPVTAVVYFKGGHTIQGTEEEPLELEYLVETVEQLKPEIDAYAVCSAMSMKNPAHELVAEKAISLIDPKPVFCSHRASGQMGMQERAATAALHAKLMPVMQKFTSSVVLSMHDHQLSCPLLIVTGSGTIMDPETAIRESGKTIASGPACTALYGAHHGEQSALVIDVGGTTTDLALIENGRPVFSESGCSIASWTTHMESVDIHTGGIGGDSLVELSENGTLALGPTRVTPLALDNVTASPALWIGTGSNSRSVSLSYREEMTSELKESPIIEVLRREGFATVSMLKQQTKLSGIPLERQLEKLTREQLIVESGFTPTDALHVLGRASFGDREKARAGAERLADQLKTTPEDLCLMIIAEVEQKIVDLVVGYICKRSWGNSLAGFLSTQRDNPYLETSFVLKLPLIGIGAAARYFLPGVAEKLATTVTFPPFAAVGNAVGAGIAGLNHSQNRR